MREWPDPGQREKKKKSGGVQAMNSLQLPGSWTNVRDIDDDEEKEKVITPLSRPGSFLNLNVTLRGENTTIKQVRVRYNVFSDFPHEKEVRLIDLLQRFFDHPISVEFCEVQNRVTNVQGEQIAPTRFTSFKFREFLDIVGVSKTTLGGALNYVNKLKSQLTCTALEETDPDISMWNSVLIYVMKILQINWSGKSSRRALQNFKFIWPRNFIDEYRKIIPIGSKLPFNRIQKGRNTPYFKIRSNTVLLILDSYNRIYDMLNAAASPSSPIQLPGELDFRYNMNKSLFYSDSNDAPSKTIKVQLDQPQKEFGNLLFDHHIEFKLHGFISSEIPNHGNRNRNKNKQRKSLARKKEIEKTIIDKKDFTLYRIMYLYWWFEDGFWEQSRREIRILNKSIRKSRKRKTRKKERNNRKSINLSNLPLWKKCNLWFNDKTCYRTKPSSNPRKISNIYEFEKEWHFVEHANIQSTLNLKERNKLEKQRPKRGRYDETFYDLGPPPKKRRKLNEEGDEEVDSGKEGGKKIKRKKKKRKKKKKKKKRNVRVTLNTVPPLRSAKFY